MKFKIIVFCFILLIGSYFLLNQNTNQSINMFTRESTLVPKKILEKKIVSTKTLLEKPIHLPTQVTTQNSYGPCSDVIKLMGQLSLSDFLSEYMANKYSDKIESCNGSLPKNFGEIFKEISNSCNEESNTKLTPKCRASLLDAKSASVVLMLGNDFNLAELDSNVLIHLLNFRTGNGEFFQNPKQGLDLINAILEKEPNYLTGYKTKLLLLGSSELSSNSSTDNVFNETVAEARKLSPNDVEIQDLHLSYLLKQAQSDLQKGEFLTYLKNQGQEHPQAWIYDYEKSKLLWDNGKGDYAEALMSLEIALKKDPTNYKIQMAIQNLKSQDSVLKNSPFMSTSGFSSSDLE